LITAYKPDSIRWDETGWASYLCLEDVYKLDEVRNALRQGDIKAASKYGKIYELRQVTNV